MATDKKDNKEAVVKTSSPVVDPVINNEGKSNPDPVNENEAPEVIKEVEKPTEGLQTGALEVEVSVSKETIIDKLLEGETPEDTKGVDPKGQLSITLSQSNLPSLDHNTPSLDEDIANATGIVGAIVGLSQKNENETMARKLMEDQKLKEVWRCCDTGYWFSRKDYAEDYAKKNKCTLEHYN